jgi:hypothetical protein
MNVLYMFYDCRKIEFREPFSANMQTLSSHIFIQMTGELNNITLSPLMMAGLYAKSLIEIEEINPPAARHSPDPKPPLSKGEEQAPDIRFLGNNARNVTILVNSKEHTFLPEDQLAFLTKILGACKLNIGDVAIVNTNNYPDTNAIFDSLNPSKIILFGTESNELNTNNIDTVSAPAINNLLGETTEAKASKSKLWSSLKQMFGV